MHLMGYWVLLDFIFLIFIHFSMKLMPFIYLHLNQGRAEETEPHTKSHGQSTNFRCSPAHRHRAVPPQCPHSSLGLI